MEQDKQIIKLYIQHTIERSFSAGESGDKYVEVMKALDRLAPKDKVIMSTEDYKNLKDQLDKTEEQRELLEININKLYGIIESESEQVKKDNFFLDLIIEKAKEIVKERDDYETESYEKTQHITKLRNKIVSLTSKKSETEAYMIAAMRTAGTSSIHDMLMNAALGLTGEAGEFADHIKKYAFQGHGLDKEHLKNELGDIMWYIALACKATGLTFDDIMKANIEKLKKRYPGEGFDPVRSVYREEFQNE